MPHAYNIVQDGDRWVLRTRQGGTVKSRHQTKRNAISAARRKLNVGDRVYVYYANRRGVDREFTITGR